MANMIKFYRGLVENLPAAGDNGALYITTDEGAIYYGTGTGMQRLGDFIQVANVASLPEKAHESCLYYCVAENILAKWNGTEWKQINKQPTAEEMKTLLGLGSLAYLSEVTEDNLGSALKEKVNAAAEGNHSHSNKDVIDGITADKVTAWDGAEKNAKDYADGLNTAMNTRVEALEAIDHDHANKAELDLIATGDKAKWDAATEKAHTHTFVEAELNKIVDGDVAKWNAVVADHLTSNDKTTLENSIKEAKKAGTDANTNIEAYKVTNDARVLAVEEDIAEIAGDNGILAQAKTYTDGKDSAMNTRVAALETAAPTHALKTEVEAVDAKFANYNTTVAQKAIDDAQDAEIAKKVDKVDGKDLIATSEIERLATLHNYDDTQVKADIAKKADAETMTTELGKKVDKVEGYSLVSDAEIERLGTLHNYDDTALAGRVTTAEGKITALEGASATHATKDELKGVDDKFANYVTTESYGVDKKATEDALADRYTKAESDGKYALKGADAYDDTALSNRVKAIEDDYLKGEHKTALEGLITAEKERAEGIEGGLRTDVDAIKGDYLKTADKTELEGKITANANAIELLTNGVSADEVDGVNDLIKYVKEHGTEVTGMQEDIAANTKAIGDEAARADAAEKALAGRLDTLEAIDHDAYVAADTALKTELQGEIVTAKDEAIAAASNQDAVVLAEAQAYTDNAITTVEGKVTELSGNTYNKEETFTKDEVNAAIASAVEAAQTWGSF